MIVCSYYPDKLKWIFVRYMYDIISKDSRVSYYENIQFSYISSKRIPNMKLFSLERSIVIIFENLCVILKYIQNQIIFFFTHRRYRNISPIYITQYYHKVLIIIHENISHLVIFNKSNSHQNVSKIAGHYINDIKNTSIIINSYL